MPAIILVRHGEVFNPNHVVYGDLPGFDLSTAGVQQVHETGKHLASLDIDVVLSSPLTRAQHTASAIARHHGTVDVRIDSRLTEFGLYPQWTGLTWEEVERHFPEQLAGYLEDATSLPDASESVHALCERMRASVTAAIDDGYTTIVIVAHQDPVQALRLDLVGRPLSELRHDPPEHASATTMTRDDGGAFTEVQTWSPQIVHL
jgi:broad specificity phosphatase PhoE